MKRLASLAFAATLILGSMTHAGGPVIVTEEAPIADVRPQGDGGNWGVPVVVGLVVLCLIACDGDDSPVPSPVVCTDENGC